MLQLRYFQSVLRSTEFRTTLRTLAMSSNQAHNTAVTSFNQNHSAYDQFRPSFNDKIVDALLSDLHLASEDKYDTSRTILELASGTGKFTKSLVNRGWNKDSLVTVEPSSGMRESFSKNFPSIPTLEGSLYKIPLETGSVDAVIIAQGFHWFADINSLKEINRVLKKGGYFGAIWNYDCPSSAQKSNSVKSSKNFIIEGPKKEFYEQYAAQHFDDPTDVSFKYFEQSPWAVDVAQYVYQFDVNVPQYRHAKWRTVLEDQDAREYFSDIISENYLLTLTTSAENEVFELWKTRSYITLLPEEKQEEIKVHLEKLLKEKVTEDVVVSETDGVRVLRKALGTHTVVLQAK